MTEHDPTTKAPEDEVSSPTTLRSGAMTDTTAASNGGARRHLSAVHRHPDPGSSGSTFSGLDRAAALGSDRCIQCGGGQASYADPGHCMACASERRNAPKEAREAFLRDLRTYREQCAQFDAATAAEPFSAMLDRLWEVPR